MNIDIAYKGLKYLVAWGLFYFVIKYTLNDQFTDIDIILIAAILTLLLCIGEFIMCGNNKIEGLVSLDQDQITTSVSTPVSTHVPTPASTSIIQNPNSMPATVSTVSTVHVPDVQSVDDSSIISSSGLSSGLSSTPSDSVSSSSNQTIVQGSNNFLSNRNEIGIKDKDYVPPIASQPLNYNVSVTQDPKYTVHDYLGDNVKLDINAFGGTAIRQNNSDNLFPNPNPTTILSTGSNIITDKPLAIDQTIKDIKINLPTNGSGQQFVRLDNVMSSTIDNSINSDGTTIMHTQRHTQDGRPLRWYEQSFNPRSYEGAENLDQIAVSGGRTRNDLLVNEMIYSDFNRMPPSFIEKDFEYGYSFLPPKDWYPLPPYPPVCASNRTCLVQPIYTDSTTMDLKDWHETQKIGPPDSLNTSFIINELNSKI